MTDKAEDGMNEPLKADPQLGSALREALMMPHDGAFVTRIRALVRQRPERTWDEVLAGWFWRGLAITACAVALVAAGLMNLPEAAAQNSVEETVASQLLQGELPGSDVILASMTGIR